MKENVVVNHWLWGNYCTLNLERRVFPPAYRFPDGFLSVPPRLRRIQMGPEIQSTAAGTPMRTVSRKHCVRFGLVVFHESSLSTKAPLQNDDMAEDPDGVSRIVFHMDTDSSKVLVTTFQDRISISRVQNFKQDTRAKKIRKFGTWEMTHISWR